MRGFQPQQARASRGPAIACAAIVLGSALTGCRVGPDYVPPEPEVPEAWNAPVDVAARQANEVDLRRWWVLLGDPILDRLVTLTLESNRDLRESAARVREARVQVRSVRGQRIPSLNASGQYDASRQSENTAIGGPTEHENLWGAGFDMSWELDLFGGIARQIEAASADLGTSVESFRDLRVSLLGDVARTYIEYRLAEVRLRIARENQDAQTKTLGLVRTRHATGLAPELDLRQAERILASTQAEIPLIQLERRTLRNVLCTLTGHFPGQLDQLLGDAGKIPVPPPAIGVGAPADLVRRRPDIRGAERSLASATARVGVATAELYPKFSLSGSFRLEAKSADLLPSGDSIRYGLGPTFLWNLFAGGTLRAQIKVEEARVDQALHRYEQTIIRAVEEVEAALITNEEERRRRTSLSLAVERASQSLRLSRAAYEEGLVDFQNVLDSQRTVLLLEGQLAENESAIAVATVRLFKALGGGWSEDQPIPDGVASTR